MRVVWSDPYVWLHLAGVATVPIWLELCFLGLAVGDPILPVWLEFFLVAAVGIGPILWMQWQRPFCIFSVVALALNPTYLSDPRRRMLRFFRTSLNRGLAIAVAMALVIVLWQLYRFAPIAADVVPLSARWQGLGVAAIAFLAANLFTQVPVTVLRLLAVSDTQLAAQAPYPAERIPRDFVLFGLRLRHILPEPKPPQLPTVPAPPAPAVAQPAAESPEQAAEPTPTPASPATTATAAETATAEQATEPITATAPSATPATPEPTEPTAAATEPTAEAAAMTEATAGVEASDTPTTPAATETSATETSATETTEETKNVP